MSSRVGGGAWLAAAMAFATKDDAVLLKGLEAVCASTIVVWGSRPVPACPSTMVWGYESGASSGVGENVARGVAWRDARGVAWREPPGDCGRQEVLRTSVKWVRWVVAGSSVAEPARFTTLAL